MVPPGSSFPLVCEAVAKERLKRPSGTGLQGLGGRGSRRGRRLAGSKALRRYPWPGNVRELRNIVERAMIASSGPTLQVALPGVADSPTARSLGLVDVEREHILHVLELTRWRVRGKAGAAEILRIKPTTLESRMAKLGIQRPGKSSDIS